jgi:hypothetical protein
VCSVLTRWHSTYLILSIVENYQKIFELKEKDENNHLVVLGFLDWENARAFVKFLNAFYDTTLNISS